MSKGEKRGCTYKGDEPSPKGKGWAARYEKEGVVKMGGHRESGNIQPRERISRVGYAGSVLPSHSEAGHEIRPTGLTSRENGLSGKIGEGIMICDDGEVDTPLKVTTPFLDYPQELLLTRGVVALGGAELGREERYRPAVLH